MSLAAFLPAPASPAKRPRPRAAALPAAQRTLRRCLVCGFAEVRTDEVVERGLVLLASCPRCDHRWTEPLGSPTAAARPVRRGEDRTVA